MTTSNSDAMAKPNEYVLGILIPGTSNPFLHMTVCVIQEPKWSFQATWDAKRLANAILPLPVAFGERDMFGPEKTLPVRLMTIRDEKKKELMDEFYRTYFSPRKGEEDRLTQKFHVSIKKILPEADKLADMDLAVMFLKVVGKDSFIWCSDKPDEYNL